MKNMQEKELQCPKQLPVMYKTNVFQNDLLSYVVRRGHLSPLFEQSPFFHFPSLLEPLCFPFSNQSLNSDASNSDIFRKHHHFLNVSV